MKEKTYKAAIGIRGDCLNCPLPLSVDSYFNCLTDCHHCSFRSLNRAWGTDLRPANPMEIYRKLENGKRNKNPRSSLAHALSLKKTIRVGSRTDPYQKAENEYGITRHILECLIELNWTFVIQTRFLHNLMLDEDLLSQAHRKGLLTLLPVISPGGEYDWEILERKRTTKLRTRFRILRRWIKKGWNIGVNGEPFIPGLHTIEQFRSIIRRLKAIGIQSYNTYNLHFNDYVAKRLHEIGIDIEKIWYYNQEGKWRQIQRQLCEISKEKNIRLGCPDFVNTGSNWIEQANTCCGVNVPNPSLFNTHYWKKKLQKGKAVDPNHVLLSTWEGIGDYKLGVDIMEGHPCKVYTMRDAGMMRR